MYMFQGKNFDNRRYLMKFSCFNDVWYIGSSFRSADHPPVYTRLPEPSVATRH